MPKIVNHDDRRKLFAEAAWRIIRWEGLKAVSVRNVAKESGMSLGSLRHYFVTQDELLSFSMKLVLERAGERIRRITFSDNPRSAAELLIGELLPLEEERRAEVEVWLAFVGGAVAVSAQGLKLKIHNELYEYFRGLIHYLADRNLLKKGVDLGLESKRLHAMIEGLVLQHILHPEELTPEEMTRLVAYHLDSLIV
ncbi:TetR/AcrR family transcriptional regulator [Paenibacillus sp. GCM10012306]|uniref:TetR/AcrR family transcriptional regulator n=1 Tax=Paenibacillus sp. GCM10012306 TaxID=3317342 RepID=UPI00361522EC